MSTKPKSQKPEGPTKRRRFFARMLVGLIYWGLVATIWGAVLGGSVVAYYAYDLPDVDDAFTATRRPAITILAADGSELATVGDLYGAAVTLQDLPPALPQAVLATEDRRFYSHFGLDVIGVARAMWVNVQAGRIRQGGSTITQQVAKNLFLAPDRTIKRKVQELLLALWLESKFTKDEIFTVYLNRVYLGRGTWGVDAAAKKYFGRPAARLSTWQAAVIAGLLKAPSRLNPISDAAAAAERAEVVLANMVAAGYLSEEAAVTAKREKASRVTTRRGAGSRYFVDWILERLPGFVSVDRDIVVHTTLDSAIQQAADRAMAKALDGLGNESDVGQGALIAMTPDGALRAMVGGRDYGKSQFNRATQALRQPGSAFKPIVYLAGLEAGLSPRSLLVDEPIDIGGWTPGNFDKQYRGTMSLRDALSASINTIAVKVAQHAGWGNVVKTARRLGMTDDLQPNPSIALGTGEVSLLSLTGAYAAFASGGMGVWPYGIAEIRDRAGAVTYTRTGGGPGRVIAPRYAETMSAMLSRVINDGGTGKRAKLDRPSAGKTGTSQDYRDGWFIGYTADLVMGVWMGNDDGSKTKNLTGGGLPAQVWRDAMLSAHNGVSSRALPGQGGTPAIAVDLGSDPTRSSGSLFGRISDWLARDR
jgi:penicillin-binding protein 1A